MKKNFMFQGVNLYMLGRSPQPIHELPPTAFDLIAICIAVTRTRFVVNQEKENHRYPVSAIQFYMIKMQH